MDFSFSDAELEIQKRARQLAIQDVKPHARSADADRLFDRSVIESVGRSGLLGGPISPDFGGLGISHVAQCLVYEELGRVDSSVRGFMAVQTGLVASCLQDWGSDEQKKRWLPGLCDASAIGCYALTESEAGSDVASIATSATRDGDSWVIDGEKIWITNGTVADVALVFAQTDPEKRHEGITAFVVETAVDGFTATPMDAPELGHRGSDHATIALDGVRVPDAACLGGVGEGFKVAMAALDHGRMGVAAGAVGVHRACLDASLDFARNRKQFGRRIGDFQMIQKTLADMFCSYEASRSLALKAAWEKDTGLSKATRTISTAKLFATEAATQAAHQAVLLHGGRGYNNEFPVERFLRDIVGLEIYEGSSNIQRIIIARDILGPDENKAQS